MRFRSLLIAMLLLIVFGGNAYATKPREAGIGIKYGFTQDASYFQGTDGLDKNEYIESDISQNINNRGTTQIPVFVQLNEELLGDSSFTYWFLDLTRLVQKDHPPKLKTGFTTLVRNQIYEVPTASTYTAEFANFYPQYSSIINNASNPSLSADYYVTKLTFGKTWGIIFYVSSERHRWGTIGLGVGINYIEGSYSINVCDPYLFSEIQDNNIDGFPKSRNGSCLKKTELYAAKINHFSWELNVPIKVYSYIGDAFEFNLLEIDHLLSLPSHYLKHENALEPVFRYNSVNLFSTVVHF